MKTVDYSGQAREIIGTKGAKASRAEGIVPCVVYGGEEVMHIEMDERDLDKLVFTPELFAVNLTVGDKTIRAIIKDAQFHPVTDRIIHVDFVELADDRAVVLNLPVQLKGTALGVRNGGKLRTVKRYVKIKALPGAIPEALEIDITKLRIGRSIRVEQMSLDGVTFLDDPSSVVVQVRAARGAIDADEEELEEGAEEGAEGEGSEAPAEASAES